MESKASAETYLKICEQLGQEPDPARIPPDLDDFPFDVQNAIIVFNKLGDRVMADIGYIGKDYTAIDLHMKVMGVQNENIFVETLLRLDERLIKKSAQEMKQARDKASKKTK